MSTAHAEALRYTLGLKLRALRRERGLQLSQLAERAGVAVSYLSEIEKGKKFPKPEKLLTLAAALEIPYDELVSQRIEGQMGTVRTMVESSWFRQFPFHLFGIEGEDVFSLVTRDPDRAGALLRTFLEIGMAYDLDVEQFLLAALRSYQQLNHNSFEDLEQAALELRRLARLPAFPPPDSDTLLRVLVSRWGYEVDSVSLQKEPELRFLRSLYLPGPPRRLLVNGRMLPSQVAFVLAREIGFRHLGLEDRPATSSWLKVESFAQVLHNFRASYFAGALLLDRERLCRDLAKVFGRERYSPEALLRLLTLYRATPETLFHRLTELLPRRFGLEELFFLRFSHPQGADQPRLTKLLNLSRVAVPHGLRLGETYCRRWPALSLLKTGSGVDPASTLVDASYLRFQSGQAEFLTFTASRPLALNPNARSSVALGLLANDALRAGLRLAGDPELPRLDVDLTCERCPLAPDACAERAAPPRLFRAREEGERRERAVRELTARLSSQR
ncbi:MAG: XRE family transcriptional regulator [Thermoanaerobaculia bacterium]